MICLFLYKKKNNMLLCTTRLNASEGIDKMAAILYLLLLSSKLSGVITKGACIFRISVPFSSHYNILVHAGSFECSD